MDDSTVSTVILTDEQLDDFKGAIAEHLMHDAWRHVGHQDVLHIRIEPRGDGTYKVSYY